MSFLSASAPYAGLLGLSVAFWLYLSVARASPGSPRMQEISESIRAGAMAFLSREYRSMAVFQTGVFLLLMWLLGQATAYAFLAGAVCSMAAGLLAIIAATKANVRSCEAARDGGEEPALLVAFNGGAVMGLAVASLGLLGIGLLFGYYGNPASVGVVTGFAMGASSVAMFARVGGGIYTKAADVGSDWAGRIEAGIPEDDPRNPGVIADHVGDNVGDVAGMGADIFESYCGAVIASIAIAATLSAPDLAGLADDAARDPESVRLSLLALPLALAVIGLFSSIAGIYSMRVLKSIGAHVALRYSTLVAAGLFLLFGFMFVIGSVVTVNVWLAILAGTVSGIAIGLVTEYYTSAGPVRAITEASQTGTATSIIQGLAVGLESCAPAALVICLGVFIADGVSGLYGIGIAAVGMLATAGVTMAVDAYGPVVDNARGIAVMAGLSPEVRAVTGKLDAVGSNTAAIGKGFAIGSAALTALALSAAYALTVDAVRMAANPAGFRPLTIVVTDPRVLIGLFLGGVVPFFIASRAMTSVGRAAGKMVVEIRRQFRDTPGLIEGREGARPDAARCVDISTRAALREMIVPWLAAFISPAAVGFLLGVEALGGMLAGATVSGVLLALTMVNAGGAWDNVKKAIEKGEISGDRKGSEGHHAALVGDTVGDPLKDTAGPAMNILIKLMSVVSLVIAPLLA